MFTPASHPRRPTAVGVILALFLGLLLLAAPAQAAPALIEVTPAPVTFPSLCTVRIPDSRVVKYTATTGGDPFDVTAGTHNLRDFFGSSPGIVFTAVPLDGYTIADGATATWTRTFTFEIAETCFADFGAAKLVTAERTCTSLTFTNLTDQNLSILYGDFQDPPSEEAALPAGGSVTIDTALSHVGFAAVNQGDGRLQFGDARLPADCDGEVDDPAVGPATGSTSPPTVAQLSATHPTAAPAAGVTGGGDRRTVPGLVLLSALTLIAVRRSYALGR